MAEFTLESIGLTNEEIQDRVIERIVERLLDYETADEDGRHVIGVSDLTRSVKKLIKERIDESVRALGEKHIVPRVDELVEGHVLQETTMWGEKKGDPVSFTEYLVQRADAYMAEKVDSSGKTKEESGGFSWSGRKTRMTHLIDSYLELQIHSAIKSGMGDVTKSLGAAIADTVRLKIDEVMQSVRVGVDVKSR